MDMEDFESIYQLGYKHGYKMAQLDAQIDKLQADVDRLSDDTVKAEL